MGISKLNYKVTVSKEGIELEQITTPESEIMGLAKYGEDCSGITHVSHAKGSLCKSVKNINNYAEYETYVKFINCKKCIRELGKINARQ